MWLLAEGVPEPVHNRGGAVVIQPERSQAQRIDLAVDDAGDVGQRGIGRERFGLPVIGADEERVAAGGGLCQALVGAEGEVFAFLGGGVVLFVGFGNAETECLQELGVRAGALANGGGLARVVTDNRGGGAVLNGELFGCFGDLCVELLYDVGRFLFASRCFTQFFGKVLLGLVTVIDHDGGSDAAERLVLVQNGVVAGRGNHNQVRILGNNGFQIEFADRIQGFYAAFHGDVGPLSEEAGFVRGAALRRSVRGSRHGGVDGQECAGDGEGGGHDVFRLGVNCCFTGLVDDGAGPFAREACAFLRCFRSGCRTAGAQSKGCSRSQGEGPAEHFWPNGRGRGLSA